METHKEEGFWKRVNANIHRFFEELKAESVAANPRKPVDCCNPPAPQQAEIKLKTSKR